MTEQYRPIKLMCKTLPSLKAAKVSESSFLTAYQLGMCVLDCLLRFGFGCFFYSVWNEFGSVWFEKHSWFGHHSYLLLT